jgi:uncharacterized protein YecE (DUF72 family)
VAIEIKLISLIAKITIEGWLLTDYRVGTGGWAYFKVPDRSSLRAYSEVFNFVEVNHTFYEYPDIRTVERWRRTVPEDFTFAVRCHQDLTHRIGLKPVDEAYYVLSQMVAYCEILDAPFLVLETPARYVMGQEDVDRARDFLSSSNFRGVRLVWELRATVTPAVVGLMQDFNIVHCVDLSKEKPSFKSDVVYGRLFGKEKHNLYQFTDDELVDIDRKAQSGGSKVVALSYHGLRMNSDAARFVEYKKTGKFMPVTSFVGVDSVRAVLSEDAVFPSSKSELIEHQGWKVVDASVDRRVHLLELLALIPERTYANVEEVTAALEGTL